MDQADSRNPSPPISFPIKDLDSLASKSYTKSFDYPYIKASVPLSGVELPSRRRLLVCHDMAGGYGDDKWVQGGSNPNAYSLWHWNLMDVFVYFSHDLITLPPPCWINAAHTHGVKVRSDPTSILGLSISLLSKNGKDKNDPILIIEGGLSCIPAEFHTQFCQVIEPSSLLKPSGWNLLETLIHMPRHVITGIHAVCFMKPESMHAPSFHAELGHLSMVDFDYDFPKTDSCLTLSCHKVSWVFDPNSMLAVNVEICWEESKEVGVNFPAMWYNIYARWLGIKEDDVSNDGERYLGLTRLGRFYVSDLNVPAGVAAIRFMVQACRYDGSCQNLDQSPWFDLPVETQRSDFDHSQGAMSNTEN